MNPASRILLTFAAVAFVPFGASGLQAAGVSVGASSLINVLDYSDTFTGTDSGGAPNRPYIAALQPAAAYVVENTYGHPTVNFSTSTSPNIGGFSIASDTAGLVNGSPAYPGTSGAGSVNGITQTGGGVDYGVPYGFRGSYVVQVDAVQTGDRIDISSGAGLGIFSTNSVSVFFRGDGSGNASLFNGVTDTPITTAIPTFNTGITGQGQWINYAVRFDQPSNSIEIFVNQSSKGVIDLTTFGGGIYANWSNAFVGVGAGMGAGNNRTWTDNFQVGAAVPEPGSALMLLGSLGILAARRRR